jgi:OOP family OmpA-OmpF porin
MNYSTLKKTTTLSFTGLLVAGMINAQSMPDSTMRMGNGTAKVFGGRGQYNTFSIGANVGVTSPFIAIGGSNDFNKFKAELGYGLSFREQLAHSFGLQLDLHGGRVSGSNENLADGGVSQNRRSFETIFWSGTLSGVVNVATIDYLRRKNALNFFVTAGAGLAMYNPQLVYGNNNRLSVRNADGTLHYIKEAIIPVGVGAKFKLSDALALNLGYTATFIDGDNFDYTYKSSSKDHYSYGYGGLELTLGSKSKQNLDWVNPVAMMYDELYDAELRREVAALKGRVGNVENSVNDLKKDSDGDGVSDQFDKCPNTPAGTVVDGAGCEIKFPVVDTSMFVRKGAVMAAGNAYSNIQFDFDSSVLRTSSYPALDATSADLRSGKSSVMLSGYASAEGTAAHNMRLSKDRANSVKTYLVNSGVDAKRVKTKGFGETHPIADNSTEEGRVMNRRVEFKK